MTKITKRMWQKSPMTFVTTILLQKSLETHLSEWNFELFIAFIAQIRDAH